MSVDDDLLESFEHHGRTVKIYIDRDAESPLGVFDMLSTLACWHRRLDLGHNDARLAEPMTLEQLRERVKDAGDEILAALPLYIYQHGGVTMRTGPFSDTWDSGQVGWGYITKTSAERMGCVDWTEAKLKEAIKGDVETYDTYLTGQVYGYTVTGREGAVIDSCWGFYGDLPYVRTEAKSAAEHSEDPADERLAQEMSERATFAGRAP
jgi:hypothetical protein